MSAVVDVEWFTHAPGVLTALHEPFDVEEILSAVDDFAARRLVPAVS